MKAKCTTKSAHATCEIGTYFPLFAELATIQHEKRQYPLPIDCCHHDVPSPYGIQWGRKAQAETRAGMLVGRETHPMWVVTVDAIKLPRNKTGGMTRLTRRRLVSCAFHCEQFHDGRRGHYRRRRLQSTGLHRRCRLGRWNDDVRNWVQLGTAGLASCSNSETQQLGV